jgi:ribonuclease Z
MNEFTLTIIGSGSALPMHGRHPSAQVVQYDDFSCLIDCGEGTQERLRPAGVRAFNINMIAISHLHGDHVFGLPGLLSSYAHLKRTEPLTIFGPQGIKGFVETILRYSETHVPFPLMIEEQTPDGLISIHRTAELEVFTFPLYHRIACNGYLFRERRPKLNLRKDMVHAHNLTPGQLQALKRGEAIDLGGELVSPTVFAQVSASPISYAYCSDTKYEPKLLGAIQGVSVLYHETTFMNAMAHKADQTGHSTAGEAGKMAAEAGASCLVTGHYSSRYKDVTELIAEAEEHFIPVIQGVEGKKYNLRNLAKGLKQ